MTLFFALKRDIPGFGPSALFGTEKMASLLCSGVEGENETKNGGKTARTTWRSNTGAEAPPPLAFPSLPEDRDRVLLDGRSFSDRDVAET